MFEDQVTKLFNMDADTFTKYYFCFLGVLGIFVAWNFLEEYKATQRSLRFLHAENLKAQQKHLEAHADLRKKLVGMARVQAQPAIDLLRQLEAQEAQPAKA
jgi:hypothetical protein